MIEFLSISLLILLAVISPGPDFVLIVRNALLYTSKVGVYTALGLALSTLFHTTYTVIGLTLFISQSPLLFTIVKYLGAGYLIYLGLKGLFHRPMITTKQQTKSKV